MYSGRDGEANAVVDDPIAARLDALEQALRENTERLRQLAEAVAGLAANQELAADNQRGIIAGLARIAHRLPER